MELRAQLRHGGQPPDRLVVEHVGVKAAQADALDARDGRRVLDQFGQPGAGVAAVARQADGGQHDLPVTGPGQPLQLVQDARLAAAAHRAARTRDDAIGALAVAAILHLDESAGMFGKFVQRQFLKRFALVVRADIHHPLALTVQHFFHILQDRVPVAGAGHNVRLRDGGGLLREGLGVAAGQHGHGLRMLALLPPQPFAAFLVAEVGHGAAVDHIHIGFFARFHHRVSARLKQLRQRAGFVLVDFAAQGIKIDPHRVFILAFVFTKISTL